VIDRGAEEDDVVLQQPRVEVERPLTTVRLLDDGGHQVVVGRLHGHSASSGEPSSESSELSSDELSSESSDGSASSALRKALSTALPSSSTSSTRSMSQSRARWLRISERSAETWPDLSNSLRTRATLSPERAAMSSNCSSSSSSVTSMSWAATIARRARLALTARVAPWRTSSRKAWGPPSTEARYWSGERPWACSRWK